MKSKICRDKILLGLKSGKLYRLAESIAKVQESCWSGSRSGQKLLKRVYKSRPFFRLEKS